MRGSTFAPLLFALALACDTESGSTASGDGVLPTVEEGDSGAEETLCDGQVVDLQTNKNHCGECDNACHGAGADDPNFDLDTPACVDGQCQVAWDFCADLSLFEGQSCEQLCEQGCVQDGCNGQTLLIKWEVPSIGVGGTCDHDSTQMEPQAGYQCGDPIPAAMAGENHMDLFSCCCAP